MLNQKAQTHRRLHCGISALEGMAPSLVLQVSDKFRLENINTPAEAVLTFDHIIYFCLSVYLSLFETGFFCVTLAELELTL